MQNIVVSLSGIGPKKISAAPPIINVVPQQVQPVDPFAFLNGIPGAERLASIPGILPFLIPGLIPDLIYLAQQGRLVEAIARTNPQDPYSIVFNDPSQEVHRETYKVEMDMMTGKIDIYESDVTCVNPKCKANLIAAPTIKQRRRADEPPTASYRCLKCRTIWSVNMA